MEKKKRIKPYKTKGVVLDKKMSMIVYLIVLVAAVACRSWQLASNMDFSTGKYIDPMKNPTLIVLIIGIILLLLVMIFGESRDKTIKSCILINPMRLKAERLNKKITPKSAAAMFIIAFLLAFEILDVLFSTAAANAEISTEDNPIFAFAGINAFQWVCYALMIVLTITFISTGINIIKGDGISRGNCFFLTVYPIWKLLQIFDMIRTYQVIGPYSEKCYILLTDMAAGMFFLFAVRFFCGYEKKHTRLWMCMFGYTASILAAVSVIPRYIMCFVIDYSIREGMMMPEVSDIGIIFCTITIIAVFWSTYVYRVMPKLNITGKRRWAGVSLDTTGKLQMKELSDEDTPDTTNTK